jgi:hypothetical protein
VIPVYSFTRVHLYQCKAHTRLRVQRASGVPHALVGREISCKASGALRGEVVNVRLDSSSLRAKRSNLSFFTRRDGLLRRFAPRNDGRKRQLVEYERTTRFVVPAKAGTHTPCRR